VVLLRKNIY